MKKPSLADMLVKFDPSRHGSEVLPELGVAVDAKPTYEADDGPLSDVQLAQIQKAATPDRSGGSAPLNRKQEYGAGDEVSINREVIHYGTCGA